MRKYGRVDRNQKALVAFARKYGASCLDLSSLGNGAPDYLFGLHGHMFLVEFKAKNGSLTPDQSDWIALWRGTPVRILRTTEDVERLLSTVLPNKRAPRVDRHSTLVTEA